MQRKGRRGEQLAQLSFADNHARLIEELGLTLRAIKRTKAMTHRVEASQSRTDKRDWVMQRRERTRHLIELGGLVQKAGLIELTDDDRAVLLGAFVAIATKLRGEEREQAITLWRRRGKRAFESGQSDASV
jgi:Conjugal transfer protein TraD